MSELRARAAVDVVIKLGGGMLRHPAALDPVLARVADAARRRRLVVVPGGGPFADAVREADARFGLSDTAGHWMAILAMDQYAHLLTERVTGGRLVVDADGIAECFREQASTRTDAPTGLAHPAVPVLAPFHWMRAADPLPHSWDVTSDSIAAWIAGALGARQLVLVKPVALSLPDGVDPHFARARPDALPVRIVAADDLPALQSALEEGAAGG